MTDTDAVIAEMAERQPDWGAMMTTRQFVALQRQLQLEVIQDQLDGCSGPRTRRTLSDSSSSEVVTWLRNGWSTETLLRHNESVFSGSNRAFALHWAFPQAYYSAYAITVALFKAKGWSETKHASVIRRAGEEMRAGKYPKAVSFLADGGPHGIVFMNIAKHSASSTLSFDGSDPDSVETQIAQFLCATRKLDLETQKPKMKPRTKAGKPKKAFSREDWEKTSQRLGPTSILSLLYRNRIRANYGEIDTYLSDDLDTESVFQALVHIVHCLNLVHERQLSDAVGQDVYARQVSAASTSKQAFVADRLALTGGVSSREAQG